MFHPRYILVERRGEESNKRGGIQKVGGILPRIERLIVVLPKVLQRVAQLIECHLRMILCLRLVSEDCWYGGTKLDRT